MRFRAAALKEMGRSEPLDEPTRLAGRLGWPIAGALVVAMLAIGTWAFAGTVSRSVPATGILSYSAGVTDLQAISPGRVEQVWVQPSDRVRTGQYLYSYREFDGSVIHEVAPWDANVIGIMTAEGQVVTTGQTVATLERLSNSDDRLNAMVFLPAVQAPMIAQGSPAEIEVLSAPAQAFGTLKGTVVYVGKFPETASSLQARMGSHVDTSRYLTEGPPVAVMIELEHDEAGGLVWGRAAPDFIVASQSEIVVTFPLSQQRPIDWVFRRW